jgi:hypothetical protein
MSVEVSKEFGIRKVPQAGSIIAHAIEETWKKIVEWNITEVTLVV